jgi:hypothetical protein
MIRWCFCYLSPLVTFAALIISGGLLFAAIIEEQEPNNSSATANLVQCGDTVLCGLLNPPNDVDYFRFWCWQADSIILTSYSCQGSDANTFMVLCNNQDSILAVDDDMGPRWFSDIRYVAPYSGEYIVWLFRQQSYPDSAYSLAILCPQHLAENYDFCTSPRIIPSLPYYDEGTTLGMTNQCGTAARDVFYQFHNPAQGNLLITVCSDLFDARVQMLGGCCSQYMDEANQGCNLGAVLASFNVDPGDYYIMVEGTSANQAGNFSIRVEADLPDCPTPGPLIITSIGGYPALDWPELTGPAYYIVWYCASENGVYDHLGTTFFTYFIDSTGYSGLKRFYKVTSMCPW